MSLASQYRLIEAVLATYTSTQLISKKEKKNLLAFDLRTMLGLLMFHNTGY